MGMSGMNDMSAMMNYGGGFGNGWQGGMNGGFENFNAYNSMGGYNQSGAQYPQMMNQFPKNNFPNQNRSSSGAGFSDRRGSYGNLGTHGSGSRPGSRSGPQQNVRRHHHTQPVYAIPAQPTTLSTTTETNPSMQPEGDVPAGSPDEKHIAEIQAGGDQNEKSTEATDAAGDKYGEADSGEAGADSAAQAEDGGNNAKELTDAADGAKSSSEGNALNQIQTVDSGDNVQPALPFQQPMISGAMPGMPPMGGMQGFNPAMMSDFGGPGPGMNMGYGGNMGFGGHHQHHHGYGAQGGYNPAYGAATVLTGEPRGVGVEGAPTGPRAMREGRPNTGFSSRMGGRHYSHASAPSVASAHGSAAASPARRGRAYVSPH